MSEPSDLLYGAPSIAAYLNMTEPQVYHLHEQGHIPTFKIGGKVCARRSIIEAFFGEQERAARENIAENGSVSGTLSGAKVIIGLRSVSQRLGISVRDAVKLRDSGRLPTYVDRRGRVCVKVQDLVLWKAEGKIP